MKKLFLMASAAALIFASCSKDETSQNNSDKALLTVKIAGSTSSTRAIETPGFDTDGTIQLDNGYIFVFDAFGNLLDDEPVAIDLTTIRTTGQQVDLYPSDSRIYIVANVPATQQATIEALTTLSGVQAAASAMESFSAYDHVPLANSNGQPATMTITAASSDSEPNTGTATISLKPLVSRLELVAVQGDTDSENGKITGFDLTGVYLDSYYPSFTWGGGYNGTLFSQGQEFTTFAGVGDAGTWSANDNAVTGTFVATPPLNGGGNTQVWAYNVASGALPRLILKLENVKYTPDGEPEEDITGGPYFVTVGSYNDGALTSFERGKIYKLNNLKFNKQHLGGTPNMTNVTLTATVDIIEWVIDDIEADLIGE